MMSVEQAREILNTVIDGYIDVNKDIVNKQSNVARVRMLKANLPKLQTASEVVLQVGKPEYSTDEGLKMLLVNAVLKICNISAQGIQSEYATTRRTLEVAQAQRSARHAGGVCAWEIGMDEVAKVTKYNIFSRCIQEAHFDVHGFPMSNDRHPSTQLQSLRP